MKVAYLGPAGTYTHQAALQEFGETAELIPLKTIDDCFTEVSRKTVDYSVVPFENSTNGQVVFTYDLLRDWFISPDDGSCPPDFRVISEQFVAIHHCLLSESTDLEKISKIYSHPQVWGQITKFLSQEHVKTIEKIDTSSTSKAAELAKKEGCGVAAIGALMASKIHNLPVLQSNIEDIQTNSTRFLVLGRTPHEPQTKDHSDKTVTSMAFTLTHNDTGALCDVLQCLHGVNLTSITSRPSHINSWQYVFFIEFWGSIQDPATVAIIDELKPKCLNHVILGSFPRSLRYWGDGGIS